MQIFLEMIVTWKKGSLRFDVNVSVRKFGEPKFRNRIEIKNMNSFSNLELAIDHEIDRQIAMYEAMIKTLGML